MPLKNQTPTYLSWTVTEIVSTHFPESYEEYQMSVDFFLTIKKQRIV